MLCIVGSRNNRKRREFLLILSQGVADTIYAVAFMLIAVHRLKLEAAGIESNVLPMGVRSSSSFIPARHLHAAPGPGANGYVCKFSRLFGCSTVVHYFRDQVHCATSIRLDTSPQPEQPQRADKENCVRCRSELDYFSHFLVPYFLTGILLISNYAVLWNDGTPTSALCIASNGAAHPIPYGIMLGIRLIANIGSATVYLTIVIYLTSASNRNRSM
ncbi:hypothetical protein ANCDUO_23952 [Ancylostoma duodenale]|uniref:Uncharacterized protein n=1 Tax=Ancylostoma duodenale TaxID=51022 RepID=A0A0C2BQD7_9BILA|nr:hypothetical protein ANCDUO_23952 [Ancylostoma duodenale]